MSWIVTCIRCGGVIRSTDHEAERCDLLGLYCGPIPGTCGWSRYTTRVPDGKGGHIEHVFTDGDVAHCMADHGGKPCSVTLPDISVRA